MPNTVNWYADDVALLLENIAEESLLQMAYQIEGEYKVNARVDTGFMRNSAYVHSDKASTFRAQSKDEHHRTIDSPPSTGDGTVYVGVGALYAIYNEVEDHALYNALQRVQRQFGGIIQSVARGQL